MITDYSKHKFRMCAVDADFLPYRAAASAEKNYYRLFDEFGNEQGLYMSKKEADEAKEDIADLMGVDTDEWEMNKEPQDFGVKHAKSALNNFVKSIKRTVKADIYQWALTGDDYYRHDLATIKKYKGNRDGLERPKYLADCRLFMQSRFAAFCSEGIEADDVISVMLWNDWEKHKDDGEFEVCGVIIDKDLDGVPGVHWNFLHNKFYLVTEEEADRWLFTQALSGDGTDNIQGCPNISKELRKEFGVRNGKGVGAKTAEKIMALAEDKYEMFELVTACYRDHYGAGAMYKDHNGVTHFKTADEIRDENLDLVFMERIKGVRWNEYKSNYERPQEST